MTRVPVSTERVRRGDDARADWQVYVDAHPGASLYHHPAFQDVIEEGTGNDTAYFLARRSGRPVGVLPLGHLNSALFGNSFVSIPYFNYAGVLADDDDARDALLDAAAAHAREAGAAHVELRQLGPLEGLDWPAKDRKAEMMRALPETPEALWKSFKPKLRAQIRRPKKEGIYCRMGGLDLLDDFYRVFARNMRDLGTPVYGLGFFRAFLAHNADRARVAVCYLSGRPVGAGIVVGWRDILEIPWASTLREHNRLAPNMLLYWTVLSYAIEHGYRRFDFGRSTVGEGTYKFKLQWGAEPHPLHWYYWLRDGGDLPEVNPDNPKYALVIKTWQRMPVALTRVIGPHLVKHLP